MVCVGGQVLVWLGDETHVHFTGDAIADSITAGAAIEVGTYI